MPDREAVPWGFAVAFRHLSLAGSDRSFPYSDSGRADTGTTPVLAVAVDRMHSGQPQLARQRSGWRAFSSIHDVEIFLATRTIFAKQVNAPTQ